MRSNETQELIDDIKKIAQMYFLAMNTNSNYEEKDRDEEYFKNDDFIQKVRNAFDKLDALEQDLINNEFFYQEYPKWWKTHYSRSTYYRVRKSSMRHFKYAFENES